MKLDILNKIIQGDCLAVMKQLPDNSVDSCITDPPAGISFMGQDWDSDKGGRDKWIAWLTEIMLEIKRILKPGAHIFVWELPKTAHWTTWAIENAGFEIRDAVYHLFSQGYPKSLDISKAIDKMGGQDYSWFIDYILAICKERKIPKKELTALFKSKHGKLTGWLYNKASHSQALTVEQYNTIRDFLKLPFPTIEEAKREIIGKGNAGLTKGHILTFAGKTEFDITAPATDIARQWAGWGTGLKPAIEVWVLARKPLSEPTVALNVMKWGTGGISISDCRVISDKKDKFLNCVESIYEYVLHEGDNNIAYIDQKRDAISLVCNFDRLFSFLVGDSYHLVHNEELNVRNHNYQKLVNFLGDCPVCFHLCDALVHLLANSDLISVQQLNDVHKYIHFFEQKDGQVVLSLHNQKKYNVHLPSEDFSLMIEDQFVKKTCCDEEYHIYQEYLELFHKNNHICMKEKLNHEKHSLDILDKSVFQHLCRICNSYGFSYTLLKYFIVLSIYNVVPLVKKKIMDKGRFPANLVLDGSEEVVKIFPESGQGSGEEPYSYAGREYHNKDTSIFNGDKPQSPSNYNDFGSASRFFYCAKPTREERNMGILNDTGSATYVRRCLKCGKWERSQSFTDKYTCHCEKPEWQKPTGNTHPSVKSLTLMKYLVKLITPKGGIVIDPFAGSGTTLLACKALNFDFIGIEKEKEYIDIANKRLRAISHQKELFE